jgi:hypothetical protein
MTDLRSQQTTDGLRHTQTPWMWAWRNDESAPASIFSMVREGHAYAVAMCPRYQKPEQWVADAKFILEAINNHENLKARVAELEQQISRSCDDTRFEDVDAGCPRAFKAASRIQELETALRQITEIEDSYRGSDWQEIDEAREIANAALSKGAA